SYSTGPHPCQGAPTQELADKERDTSPQGGLVLVLGAGATNLPALGRIPPAAGQASGSCRAVGQSTRDRQDEPPSYQGAKPGCDPTGPGEPGRQRPSVCRSGRRVLLLLAACCTARPAARLSTQQAAAALGPSGSPSFWPAATTGRACGPASALAG